MSKLSTAHFNGKSGDQYLFEIYSRDDIFREGMPGIYVLAKRYKLPNGNYTLDPLFIGEKADLSVVYGYHRNQNLLEEKGFNVKCVYEVRDEQRRKAVCNDLLDSYDPPCQI